MNCLEFRRAIAVQPRQLDARARTHRDECPGCAEAYSRALRFEATLDRGLAISVPTELADRILLAQTTQSRQQASGRKAWMLRIAAALVLSVGVIGVAWLALTPRPSLAAISVAHLSHEPMALTSQQLVAGVKLRETFERFGIKLKRTPGDVHYLMPCPLGAHRSLHMVMQKPAGAVTVMYVAGAQVTRRDFSEGAVLGREVPFADGALVMLAASRVDFEAIESGFRAAL